MYSALLIDDEPWALRGLEGSCDWSHYGFDQVSGISNPHEALACLEHTPPDVVISDIRMPELSGIDLLRFARAHQITCEFIFVSGFSEFQYAQDAINNGAFAYLLKPIDVQALQDTLENVCRRLQEKRRDQPPPPDTGTFPPGYLNQNFIDLLQYVNKHFADDLTLPKLSGQYHLNQTYISDLFRKATGKSFSKYLTELRIQHACVLLKTTHMAIQEVSRESGYRDYCNFVRAFKQVMQETPAKFRNGDGFC